MLHLFIKDLRLFFKDRKAVILAFLLPIILIILFAMAYGSLGNTDGRSEPVKLLVSDLDKTGISSTIVNRLDSLAEIKTVPADSAKARELVVRGKYACAMLIHKGFGDSLRTGSLVPVVLIYDRSREIEIGIVYQGLSGIMASSAGNIVIEENLRKYILERFPFIGSSMGESILGDAMKIGTEKPFIAMKSVVAEKNDVRLGLVQAVAGTAILMLLFSVAGIGTSILEEKENGTINRLLYSPLKGSTILYSKMLFAFFISIVQLSVMFIFAWLSMGLDLGVNLPGLALMIISTSIAVSSLGIFLAAIAKTRQQAQNLSTITILVMSALGGSMIPLFIMPAILQKMAVLSINYWAIQGFYDLFWRQLPLAQIMPEMLVLVISGLLISLVSVRLFKSRIMRM
ncbi:MAG: ABC transporter permease [Bacteroidales bacterium]|jgi:ABC-type multidrug transport system permease subunit|nr:ABC transporter permease [Bacteroidales bacterium]